MAHVCFLHSSNFTEKTVVTFNKSYTRTSFSAMASSSASRVSKYDVFLSFRGDTRHSVVSHLYAALTSRGIVTFKDDKRLEIGDHISDELQRAIQVSDFAVVLLSENYATSKWCLMELQLIMELHMEGRLVVVPVFYKVKPSSVRHQRESFDLRRYQRPEEVDKVPKWREALRRIAKLKGQESERCIDEATMVRDIAQYISRRYTSMHNIDLTNIVGVDSHMQDLKSLLDMDSKNDDVRMIGIWGMGGIGKTTIAMCLYEQLASQFTISYFTEDIKGIHKDNDLLRLQKKLLYSTLGEDFILSDVATVRKVIASRLVNHKVLLVLDGVDKVDQIHALAKTAWFGRGSRIIITTRDIGLLNRCGVKTHKVKCLDDKDSLQMFKHIAFEGASPPDGFEQLSIRTARLAHGLPSALEVYDLFLLRRTNSPEEWEDALWELESTPDEVHEDIMEILKISYNSLAKPLQNAFLQVACLFNGDTFQRVASLLDGSKPDKMRWMKVLAEKSLISRTINGHVILHKLVEQMGREIMTDSQQFLGDTEKIHEALAKGEFPPLTECISLHTCEITSAFSTNSLAFGSMCHLKFLKVYKHVDDSKSRLHFFPEDQFLSNSCTLRLLHWDAFPLSILPYPFYKDFIVELNLRHSNLETLWNGPERLVNLKKLDVTGSKNLKKLPILSNSKNLDELILEQCLRLKGIPESIGEGSTLGKLNLSYYGGPESPMGVVILGKLITLEFPTASVEMQLMNVSITGDILFRVFEGYEGYAQYFSFSSERQIPATTTIIIHTLYIRRFNYEEDGRPITFRSFPKIPGLKELNLVNLNIQNLSDRIGHLEFLEKLDFSGNDFKNLPEDMNRLSRLKTLWLRNCSKLEGLPELTQVQSLTLSNCRSLISLVKLSDASQDPGRYCLLELCLDNCKNVESLSDQLSHFNKLTYLDLSSHDFETLPSSIGDLTCLVTLCLNNCKKLKSAAEIPMTVQFVEAQGCDSLESDALEQFKETKRRGTSTACFQETEMLSYEKDYQAQRSAYFQETEMPSYQRDHQATKSCLPKFLCCSYFYATPIIVLFILILCEQLRL